MPLILRLQIFRSYSGQYDDIKIFFWNYLTFRRPQRPWRLGFLTYVTWLMVVLCLNCIFISGGKIVGEIRVLLAAGLGTQVYRLNLLIDEDESSYSSKNIPEKLQIRKVRTLKFMLSNPSYEISIFQLTIACQE